MSIGAGLKKKLDFGKVYNSFADKAKGVTKASPIATKSPKPATAIKAPIQPARPLPKMPTTPAQNPTPKPMPAPQPKSDYVSPNTMTSAGGPKPMGLETIDRAAPTARRYGTIGEI